MYIQKMQQARMTLKIFQEHKHSEMVTDALVHESRKVLTIYHARIICATIRVGSNVQNVQRARMIYNDLYCRLTGKQAVIINTADVYTVCTGVPKSVLYQTKSVFY